MEIERDGEFVWLGLKHPNSTLHKQQPSRAFPLGLATFQDAA